MTEILKFAGWFVLTYLVLLISYQSNFVSSLINKSLRSLSTSTASLVLPSADISQQNLKGKTNSSSDMYLVYGNPYLIQRAKDEAKASGQAYASIPTKSLELRLFEMFVVPLFFIISLFVATPMNLKDKLKAFGITMGIVILFILIKLVILVTFEISNARIGIYELEDTGMSLLARCLGVFSLGFTLMLTFILWLILGFRKSNFIQIFNTLFKNV